MDLDSTASVLWFELGQFRDMKKIASADLSGNGLSSSLLDGRESDADYVIVYVSSDLVSEKDGKGENAALQTDKTDFNDMELLDEYSGFRCYRWDLEAMNE